MDGHSSAGMELSLYGLPHMNYTVMATKGTFAGMLVREADSLTEHTVHSAS
jgi:hypothetical protein